MIGPSSRWTPDEGYAGRPPARKSHLARAKPAPAEDLLRDLRPPRPLDHDRPGRADRHRPVIPGDPEAMPNAGRSTPRLVIIVTWVACTLPPICVLLRSPAMLGGVTPNWAFCAVTGPYVTAIGCCGPGMAGIVVVTPDPVLLLYCVGWGCQPGRMRPRIRYCSTPAGRVAYSTSGTGPALLCDSGWDHPPAWSAGAVLLWQLHGAAGRALYRDPL